VHHASLATYSTSWAKSLDAGWPEEHLLTPGLTAWGGQLAAGAAHTASARDLKLEGLGESAQYLPQPASS